MIHRADDKNTCRLGLAGTKILPVEQSVNPAKNFVEPLVCVQRLCFEAGGKSSVQIVTRSS